MTDRPTFSEAYTLATSADDLTVRPGAGGAVDVIVTAAWSRSRFGVALLRLCRQWEVEKPPRLEPRSVEAFEAEGYTHDKAKLEHEREVHVFEETAYRQTAQLIARLRDLPEVRSQLAAKAAELGMDDPCLKAAAVLRFWLDRVCRECEGRGYELFPGTRKRSTRTCRACQGSRVGTIPYGEDGLRLCEFLKGCQCRASAAIRRNLADRAAEKGSGRPKSGPQGARKPEDGDSVIRVLRAF